MGLSLRGQSSGAIDINAPNAAGNNTITLPGSNGAANQFYKNSGTAGTLTHSSMIELSNGRIGIGSDNPNAALSVLSTAYPTVTITRDHPTNYPRLRIANTSIDGADLDGLGSGGGFRIACVAAGVSTERVRLTSTGCAIISSTGTFSPYVADANFQITDDTNAKLVISNPGNSSYSLAVGTDNDLKFRNESTAVDSILINYSTNNLEIVDGNLKVASGHGIDFSATNDPGGMASELLDDYEEGTWTPTIGGNATYTNQVGTYVKVGRMVYAHWALTINAQGTGSNISAIDGLPYPSGVASQATSNLLWSGFGVSMAYAAYYVGNASTLMNLSYIATAAAALTNNPNGLVNGATMNGTIVYYSSY